MGMFTPQIRVKALEGLCRRVSTALEAGIDARTVWKREAERATGPLQSRLLEVSDAVSGGQSLADALEPTGDYFPAILHEMVAVGEQSGKIVESMGHLAQQYQDRAKMAMAALAVVAGIAVVLVIAAIIITLIFRIFITSYLGPINDALKMRP